MGSTVGKGEFPGRLPRLPREYYQGDSFVHWSLSIEYRATGWLTDSFHSLFRELMLHAATREGLICPAYCLMPDHLHLVWMGLRLDSDQLNGMKFLRTHLEPALAAGGQALRHRASHPTRHSSRRALQDIKFQAQAHDNVLRQPERQHEAFARVCFYIMNNPVRANLVVRPGDWEFCGALVPGYPTLHLLNPDFWDKFWRLYAKALQPDAGNIKRPAF
jgi:REP element-mobilizing transposase RayT